MSAYTLLKLSGVSQLMQEKEGPVESMEVNAGRALCGGITLHAISQLGYWHKKKQQPKPSTETDGAHSTIKLLFTSDEDLRQRCCSVPGCVQHLITA